MQGKELVGSLAFVNNVVSLGVHEPSSPQQIYNNLYHPSLKVPNCKLHYGRSIPQSRNVMGNGRPLFVIAFYD